MIIIYKCNIYCFGKKSRLRQIGDRSMVHSASHPLRAGIGSCPAAALIKINKKEWMDEKIIVKHLIIF